MLGCKAQGSMISPEMTPSHYVEVWRFRSFFARSHVCTYLFSASTILHISVASRFLSDLLRSFFRRSVAFPRVRSARVGHGIPPRAPIHRQDHDFPPLINPWAGKTRVFSISQTVRLVRRHPPFDTIRQ